MELPQTRGVRGLRPLLAGVALTLIVWSTVMASLSGERLWVPAWLAATGGVIFPLALGLLVYSMFLELPLSRTYLRSSRGPNLITTGTYALVRHPTLLWFAIGVVSLVLLTHSQLLLIALPIWLVLDTLWVLLQDNLSLPRAFPGYEDYRKTTPMIVPTRQSLRACLSTIRSTRKTEARPLGR
jgi:protein-S-isoprenylcysteine O-methyltransferase Ste14